MNNDKDLFEEVYLKDYIKCPKCNSLHPATWVGIGDKDICEDCHMDMLGYKED